MYTFFFVIALCIIVIIYINNLRLYTSRLYYYNCIHIHIDLKVKICGEYNTIKSLNIKNNKCQICATLKNCYFCKTLKWRFFVRIIKTQKHWHMINTYWSTSSLQWVIVIFLIEILLSLEQIKIKYILRKPLNAKCDYCIPINQHSCKTSTIF